MLGIVHDEDALDVQLDAAALVAVPHVERRLGRDVQQLRVFAAAFDAVVRVRERRLEVVRHMLVELVVLFRRNVDLVAGPQGAGLVDGFVFVLQDGFLLLFVPLFLLHDDRQRDMVRILADDGLDLPARQQFVLAFAQVQDDVRAARRLVDRFDAVIAFAA